MNPYALAFAASICFGVVVFPWQSTIRQLGPGGFFLVTGSVYFLTGAVAYFRSGIPGSLNVATIITAVVTALLYVGALLLCSVAFGTKSVNLPVAVALTATYPAWTALLAVIFLKYRLSGWEMMFLAMVVVGIVGLAMTSKPTI